MKVIKKLLYFIVFLIIAGCAGILVFAFNPSLTAKLAEKIEGAENIGPGDGGTQPGSQGGNRPIATEKPEGPSYLDAAQPGVNPGWMIGRGESYYEQPDRQPAKAPEGLGSLVGFEPVKGEEEQIQDEEADGLTGILAPGDTGSDLTFDAKYYPYYAMLEPSMKQLYNQIYANARALTVSFTPVVTASVGQVKTVFEAVCNDHPELFWLETGYSCKYLRSGSCVEIALKYNDTIYDLTTATKRFNEAAESVLAGARAQSSDLEKERYVHDALMQMTEYDKHSDMNQSAISALVNGQSVCAGYAKAFQYLMQQLGIPCYYCTGTAGEDHAWNIVKLENTYYNVDVTWDDTRPATYNYFNKTDAAFAPTHVRTGLSVYLPACVEKGGSGEGGGISAEIAALINKNPTTPLKWNGTPKFETNPPGLTAEEKKQENLNKAGITADQVRENMKDYYEDCQKLLVEAGKGDKTFSNVIPESLWDAVEKAYYNGDYWKGYAEEALKKLEVENLVIHVQAQRLGGGYYRLYHNVYTY